MTLGNHGVFARTGWRTLFLLNFTSEKTLRISGILSVWWPFVPSIADETSQEILCWHLFLGPILLRNEEKA